MPRHFSQGMAATSGTMHARHVTNPREASPDESECDTWTSHRSMGPPERLNRLKSTCTPGTDLRAHKIATPEEAHLEGGPPGVGRPLDRPNRPWVGRSRASTWCLPIGPRGCSQGVSLLLTPVLRPINRRGGGSFLTNTPYL
jgi:hypothetical protein